MRRPTVACALALFLAVGLQAPAQSPCGPSGLTLATSGGRLGDPFSLTLSGTPSVSGVLGLDLAPGPVATPIGNLCLGLSPALQTVQFTLSATGTWGVSGLVPPNPALAGLGVYLQAAAADATQPGGFAKSNGAHPVLRAPHLFLIDKGQPYPTTIPGSGVAYDALTDTFGPVVPLPAPVQDAVAVPALGWVVMALGNSSLLAFDAATGAVTLNLPLGFSFATRRIAVDGTTLVISEQSSMAITLLRTFSLPLGTPGPGANVPVSGIVQSVFTPGNGTAYLAADPGLPNPGPLLFPIVLSSGAQLAPISLGPGWTAYDWLARNGTVYCLLASNTGPSALNAVDTTLNAPFFPSPVPLPFWGPLYGTPNLFMSGPGTLGPTLFVQDPIASTLLQRSPQTLSYLAPSIPLPQGIRDMKLSNGGTEWLLSSCPICSPGGCSGGPCPPAQTLLSLNASTHILSTVGQLPSGNLGTLHVLPSATLNKAYFFTNGTVSAISTDPATPPGPAVPLPFTPQGPVIVVVD